MEHAIDPAFEEREAELAATKRALFEAYRERSPEEVANYELVRSSGEPVTLAGLFGDAVDLVVVHNMGRDCRYCTMWADGFEGIYEHVQDRAAFVVCSPDPPAVQREFADERGWTFPMVSGHDSSFIEDVGFASEDTYRPGVSTFSRREDGTIVRVASRTFGSFDDYCPVWNVLGLLPDGPDGWKPEFEY